MTTRSHQLPAPFRAFAAPMDRLFESFFAPIAESDQIAYPEVDVAETAEDYRVAVELPGFARDEIELSIHDNELHIAANHTEDAKSDGDDGVTWLRRERRAVSFRRTLRMPLDIDATKVDAKLENGVLEVVLPKAEQTKPRRIEVGGR